VSEEFPRKRTVYAIFKDIRRAIETDESIKCRIETLRLVMREKKYDKFVKRHQGQNQIIDFYFPLLLNSMPGVSSSVASALREFKIITIRKLRKNTDKDLLAIKGVGPAALKKIREFTEKYCGDDTLDRVDAVKR
jgi:ERCC4-type nuclease